MNKIKRLEKYLLDFFSSRFEDMNSFYHSTHSGRHYGIYKLKNGDLLMNLLIQIHSVVEEKLYSQQLIPQKFVTPEALLSFLDWFKKYLNDSQKYLDLNFDGENTSYIIIEIQSIKDDLVRAIDYVKNIYDYEDTKIPYQELRYKLIVNDIGGFVEILSSVLASVSYAIYHTREGYHHSNVHLILKLLGFDILSEEMTSNGRIDAVIRFSDKIYIVEFKFDDTGDLSGEALQQIKDKEYAKKFIIENKDIWGVGISFGKDEKNINGFKSEKLG